MAEGKKDHLFDVTSRRQSTSSACSDKRVLGIVVCIAVAFAEPALVRAQDAVTGIRPEPTILPELSKRTGPEPLKAQGTPIPDTEKPSLEVLGGAPSEKAAPIVKQERPPKVEAIPVAAEKKTPPAKHTIVQPKAPEPVSPMGLTLSALKTVATSAPLPEYPYQAKRAHVTGSGICNLVVDSTNGKVTSATMAQSTGSRVLDKVTTDTFGRWRFKPGTISQVKVPISYE
jgi:TonB family protein